LPISSSSSLDWIHEERNGISIVEVFGCCGRSLDRTAEGGLVLSMKVALNDLRKESHSWSILDWKRAESSWGENPKRSRFEILSSLGSLFGAFEISVGGNRR
jgi:hypothetical protein